MHGPSAQRRAHVVPRVLIVVAMALASNALAGCASDPCRATDAEPCDTRLKAAFAAVLFDDAFDRAVAEAAVEGMGYALYDDPGQANYTGHVVAGTHESGRLLRIVVSPGHSADPDGTSWGFTLEFPYDHPNRAMTKTEAAQKGQDLEAVSRPVWDRELSGFEDATGWTYTGEVSWRSITGPVED